MSSNSKLNDPSSPDADVYEILRTPSTYRWTDEEIVKLKDAVEVNGRDWQIVSDFVKSKTPE